MKDYRRKQYIDHDYRDVIGDVVIVPRANRIDRVAKKATLILFGILIGFYFWG